MRESGNTNQLFSHGEISEHVLSYSVEGLMPRRPCRALYAADGQTRVLVIDPVSERAPLRTNIDKCVCGTCSYCRLGVLLPAMSGGLWCVWVGLLH